ncbi:MAG: hypothetical protein RIB58_08055 [Phycisphaerales bacterium]
MGRRADRKDADFLIQCKVLAKRWQEADPSVFGLTELEVDQFVEMVLKAGEARDKAQRARLLAKARFLGQREAFANLRGLFGALVGSVDVKAKRAGARKARSVYAAAGIDPPEKPAPRPTPAEPRALAYKMWTNGEIEVSFQIDDRGRGGLLYEAQRRLMPLGEPCPPWLPLDIVADKAFVDRDVPPGLRQVEYRVRAMRASGTKSDWSSSLIVPFGTVKSAPAAMAQDPVPTLPSDRADAARATPPERGARRAG